MTLLRSHIVASARSFLGVPWRHQGRARVTGVDCVGLVYAVAEDLGLLPPEGIIIPPYRAQPDASLLSYFDRYMDSIPLSRIKDGTAVVFSFGGSPHHAGIVVNASARAIVHAYASRKAVVVDYLDGTSKGRQLLRAFDYRGVQDG